MGVILFANFKKLKIENISSNRILSATQDSTGFVWIGTDEGLNRYDGFSNKVYRSNIFDENTISGNRIWITYIDKSNTLWVGTDRGLCYYDKEKDLFYRIETGSRPIHLVETDTELYFTTTNSGILSISKETKEINRYQFDPLDPFSLSSSKFSDNQSTPMTIHDNSLWIGTTNGLNKTNINTGQTTRFYSGKTPMIKADTITSVLIIDSKLYIGTTRGLGITDLSLSDNIGQNLGIAGSSYIRCLFEIRELGLVGVILENEILILKGNVIIQTISTGSPLRDVTSLDNGEYFITSRDHKEALLLTVTQSDDISFKKLETPIKPRNIFVDQEEGTWIVGDDGLMRSGNTTSPVKIYPNFKIEDGQFSKDGYELFLLENNSLLMLNEGVKTKVIIKNLANQINKKTGLYVSRGKDIFLFEKKLEMIDNKNNSKILAIFDTQINSMLQTGLDIFISLKNSGIAHVNLKTGLITDYRKNRLLSKILPSGASCFFMDGSTLWIGNDESGLYQLEMKNPELPKLIKHHTYLKSDLHSFSSSSVSCIEKHLDLLFIGTNGDGIFIYNNGNFDNLSIDDGLPSNNIISFAGSSDSTIWALTNGGLALVNWKSRDMRIVGPREGLRIFYRDKNALISKKDGSVFVISPRVIQEIDAEKIYTNEFEAFVTIESVQLIDKQNKKHDVEKNNIKVTHTTPTIKINLTAPAIFKSENTTFSYFIDGYHNSWVDNGNRRYIELQGLDPGKYTANIKSYNSDGYESINTARIAFQIIPPWWKTWWAYILYISTIFGLFAYYVKYQKDAQAKASEEERREEELEEARKFQLDMLPKETPTDLGLDISATIETASEVGGDYYDYFPQKDKKSLYVVVGDATGHGMTAGMMVSITKAGLYGIPAIPPNDIAKRLNRVIKNIDLGWNRMAINVAKIWEDRVEITSAAMPPVYHFHGSTKKVDEILIKGLPLGSLKDESFTLKEVSFNKNDSLIFISDGLPEATNIAGDMLGYEAVFNCIKENGHLCADDQKQALLDLGSGWLGDLRNQDDITIVIVKKK